MHKFINTSFTYYYDFYENRKEYESKGIDNPYIPNEEWLKELGNKYYFIWEPQTNRRKKLEVVYGEITRGQYGEPHVYGKYLDKPFHSAYWDNYFPEYCWTYSCNFLNLSNKDRKKYGCLVFDNEKEARDYCNKYNLWDENRINQKVKNHLNSDKVKKEFKEFLNNIKKVINNIDENDTENFYEIIKDIYWKYEIFRK